MRASLPLTILALALGGCGASDGNDGDADTPTPALDEVTETPTETATPTEAPTPTDSATPTETPVTDPSFYAFTSNVADGSSVSYSGQTFRHILIADMKAYLSGLTASIDDGSFVPAAGDVTAALNFYYRFDSSVGGDLDILFSSSSDTLQSTYNDISSDKDLSGKIAGNDSVGQHKDWSEGIIGWDEGTSPEALVDQWIAELDGLAVDRANGEIPRDLDGQPVSSVFITADGRDLQQLLQKFLDGAVGLSQGADDYLDDDEEGKGLLSDNSGPSGDGSKYTALEHQWDEGFGYFGAARNYVSFTDEELAGAGGREGWSGGAYDLNGDGLLDLTSEVSFGHSINAGKRDLGSSSEAATDFTAMAFTGFLEGRTLIHEAGANPLSDAQMDTLKGHRDQALLGWESAISATTIHYINDMIQDIDAYEAGTFSFADYAKHFSEMKGFALAPQFNPHSPVSDEDLGTFHSLVGTHPVLPNDDGISAYRSDLLTARALLGAAYGFDDANLGDDDGLNGW